MSSACLTSASRSSGSSSPTESRTRPGVIPKAARCASLSRWWVVVAGCVTIDFASPRLLEIVTIRSAFKKAKAADWPPARSSDRTVPPCSI